MYEPSHIHVTEVNTVNVCCSFKTGIVSGYIIIIVFIRKIIPPLKCFHQSKHKILNAIHLYRSCILSKYIKMWITNSSRPCVLFIISLASGY